MSDKSKEERNGQVTVAAPVLPADIKKSGVLRKLKTMKKKYFVLRMESESGPARLEYYDSEKKYRAGIAPKRSITIKKCFNINRKVDAKQKLAIALYTKDDCFSVVTENEQSLDDWLKAMLELQLDTVSVNGSTALRPKFEHVWQVTVGDKSLACSRNMKGLYRLCLTNTSLTLVKMEQSDTPECLEFPLMSIRRCGHSNNYFFFELGRSSITGAGEFWLETEDVVIAQNMHEVTLNAMKTSREHDDMGPHRPRSASNTETSRPITTRRPVAVVTAQPSVYPSIRNRCDSMPSRPRTISEGQEIGTRGFSNPPLDSLRSHMGYSHSVSYSPPGVPNPLSPSCCSTDSAGSSLSIDDHDGIMSDFAHIRYSHSVPTDSVIPIEPPIKEEQFDYMSMNIEGSADANDYVHMGSVYSASVPNDRFLYLNLNPSENVVRSNTTTSSASQSSDYMDMTSPVSLPGDYIHMSPVGSEVAKANLESLSSTWMSNKTTDGYLFMAPVTTSSSSINIKDGYLEMLPLSSSLPKPPSVLSGSMDMCNAKDCNFGTSNTSIASTPDGKPEVYQLDKVKSLLAQSDDTSEDYIRPVRAYSMGSRPQVKKTHLSIHNDGSRIRAYSVGSQAASARNKILNSVDRDLGSMKGITVRTGAKSSSAPLLHNRPPRIRSSGSRGDMDTDLMEIDYNKTRSYGVSLNEKDFTIEPVGRSRSGSCSSSSAASSYADKVDRRHKIMSERDKPNMYSAVKSKSVINNSEMNDYLPMSPSSMYSSISTSWMTSSPSVKPMDNIHPSGDYVSLNPAVKYSTISNNNSKYITMTTNPNDRMNGPTWKPNIVCDPCDGNTNDITSNQTTSSNTPAGEIPPADSSDYICMDFVKTKSEELRGTDNISPNNGNVVNKPAKPAFEIESVAGDSSEILNHGSTMPESVLNLIKENILPKTPPPSPKSGFVCDAQSVNSSDHLLSTLKKHLAKVSMQSAPNSHPGSTYDGLWLNYASLDLSPPTDEDTSIMPVHCTRQAVNTETKEVPLSYAHIDFSSAKTSSDALKESSSHL